MNLFNQFSFRKMDLLMEQDTEHQNSLMDFSSSRLNIVEDSDDEEDHHRPIAEEMENMNENHYTDESLIRIERFESDKESKDFVRYVLISIDKALFSEHYRK